MAWTQTDIDKLKAAMGGGIKRVQYTSGSVEYATEAAASAAATARVKLVASI